MVHYVTGFHAVEEYLKKINRGGVLLIGKKNRRTLEIAGKAKSFGVPVRYVDEGDLNKLPLSPGNRDLVLELHEVPKAEYTHLEHFLEKFESPNGLVLVLDGITDVHNLGAILRTADLFAADAVVIPAKRSAKEGDVVARISSGASAFVSVLAVTNTVRSLGQLKKAGFWIYGADMAGSPAQSVDLKGRVVLVMGSEGSGMARLTAENCDALLKIPSAGHVDSFNVSVAAGILMYEIRRQQGFPGFP
jgi:23S rRNA (guanosine2251-2'-O)-methyltransferase